jgi:UDP-2,3-diacylglucosamine pyrophosphatase LpxH
MKIALASDIHLEFGPIVLDNTEGADVLVLAGDICQAVDVNNETTMGRTCRTFFRQVSDRFPRVIYIMGNHEHYQGDYARSRERLAAMLADLGSDNVHLLEKDTVTIEDVTFIGGTLWTDFNREDSLCMWNAGQSMNDYRVCRNSGRGYSGGGYASRLQPEDTLKDHQTMLDYIDIVVGEKPDQQFVVVGHHAPCSASVAEQYRADTLMNGNFYSDLTEFIMNRPQIKLWVHGHMHNNSDYMIGTTRVACNPRGYAGYEARADSFRLQYLEV